MPIMILAVDDRTGRPWRMLAPGYDRVVPPAHTDILKAAMGKVLEVNSAQYDIIRANYVQGQIGAETPVKAVASIDPAAFEKIIKDAVDAALKDATVSSTITDKDKAEISALTVAEFVKNVAFAAK